MHRLMVTSATYRQSSTPSAKTLASRPREHPVQPDVPPPARRRGGPRRPAGRLGQLDRRVGGPSVFPDLPPGVETRGGWTRSASAADRNRRSIYVFVRRNLKYPLFDAFDAPDTNTTCPERNVSVNAPQALMLLNSDLILDQARAFAGRVLPRGRRPQRPAALVRAAYRLALGRDPDADELARGVAFLEAEPALAQRADPARPARPDARRQRPCPGRGAGRLLPCAAQPERVRVRRLMELAVGATRRPRVAGG